MFKTGDDLKRISLEKNSSKGTGKMNILTTKIRNWLK